MNASNIANASMAGSCIVGGSLKVDENGKALAFNLCHQNSAEHLIENFMIIANETIATHKAFNQAFEIFIFSAIMFAKDITNVETEIVSNNP